MNGETFNVSFNIDDSNSSIIYEVTNNEDVWNNLDDGKHLGSGIITGAVRFDNTPPEIKEIALLSSNPGENKDDYPQLDNKHTRLLKDNDTLTLVFKTSEQIRDKPDVTFYTDYDNFTVSGIEEIPGTVWNTETTWKAELYINKDHTKALST